MGRVLSATDEHWKDEGGQAAIEALLRSPLIWLRLESHVIDCGQPAIYGVTSATLKTEANLNPDSDSDLPP